MKSDQKLKRIFTGLIRFDHFLHFVVGIFFFILVIYSKKKTFLTAAFIGPRLVSETTLGTRDWTKRPLLEGQKKPLQQGEKILAIRIIRPCDKVG